MRSKLIHQRVIKRGGSQEKLDAPLAGGGIASVWHAAVLIFSGGLLSFWILCNRQARTHRFLQFKSLFLGGGPSGQRMSRSSFLMVDECASDDHYEMFLNTCLQTRLRLFHC